MCDGLPSLKYEDDFKNGFCTGYRTIRVATRYIYGYRPFVSSNTVLYRDPSRSRYCTVDGRDTGTPSTDDGTWLSYIWYNRTSPLDFSSVGGRVTVYTKCYTFYMVHHLKTYCKIQLKTSLQQWIFQTITNVQKSRKNQEIHSTEIIGKKVNQLVCVSCQGSQYHFGTRQRSQCLSCMTENQDQPSTQQLAQVQPSVVNHQFSGTSSHARQLFYLLAASVS